MNRSRQLSESGSIEPQWRRRESNPRTITGTYIESPYPEIEPDFGHWLAGFADGEGCFYLGMAAAGGGVVSFSLTLRADDEPVLEQARSTTGLGEVVSRIPTPDYRRPDGREVQDRPTSRWTVTRKRECQRLVEIFDRYPLRAKKARDFAIWRHGVAYHATISQGSQGRGNPKANWGPFAELVDELRRVRQYDAPEPEPKLESMPAQLEFDLPGLMYEKVSLYGDHFRKLHREEG